MQLVPTHSLDFIGGSLRLTVFTLVVIIHLATQMDILVISIIYGMGDLSSDLIVI